MRPGQFVHHDERVGKNRLGRQRGPRPVKPAGQRCIPVSVQIDDATTVSIASKVLAEEVSPSEAIL